MNFASSRAELIEQARENCSKNLSYTPNKNKEKGYSALPDLKEPFACSTKKTLEKKGAILRFLIALVLFLSFAAIDQFDLEYQQINSHFIADFFKGEKTLTKIKQEVFILTQEKIIPVFHRLEE